MEIKIAEINIIWRKNEIWQIQLQCGNIIRFPILEYTAEDEEEITFNVFTYEKQT